MKWVFEPVGVHVVSRHVSGDLRSCWVRVLGVLRARAWKDTFVLIPASWPLVLDAPT